MEWVCGAGPLRNQRAIERGPRQKQRWQEMPDNPEVNVRVNLDLLAGPHHTLATGKTAQGDLLLS